MSPSDRPRSPICRLSAVVRSRSIGESVHLRAKVCPCCPDCSVRSSARFRTSPLPQPPASIMSTKGAHGGSPRRRSANRSPRALPHPAPQPTPKQDHPTPSSRPTSSLFSLLSSLFANRYSLTANPLQQKTGHAHRPQSDRQAWPVVRVHSPLFLRSRMPVLHAPVKTFLFE